MTEGKRIKKDTACEVKIFPVPLSLTEDIQNIVISTNTPSKRSKEQIINKAFKFHSEGKISEAAKYYQQCINLGFNDQRIFSNYGGILRDLGKLEEAELSTRKAIELKPDYAMAYSNLGSILKDLGKLEEAELSTRKAIELKTDFAEAYYNLGGLLRDLGKLKEAELSTRKAIELKPDFALAHSSLGNILSDLGKYKEANNCFKKCLKLDSNDLSYNLQARLLISYIQLNQSQIEKERKEINKQISLIGNNKSIIYKNNTLPNSIDFIFYLAYHNCENDKEILENIANNLSKKKGIIDGNFNVDQHIKESLARKKIRLAICSSYFFEHSVTRCYLNIIENLAKSGVELIILRGINDKVDEITEHIISLADETISLPESLEKSCQIILNKSFDVLLYLDIGMSRKTYFMSLSRLALVQVVLNGHPNTTGSPNVDYFISSKYLETENSDQYYSERLIKLTRLPVSYSIPKSINSNFKVSKLNILDNDFIIGLPHTSFKYHPDFDDTLSKILAEIPRARLLFFGSFRECETNELLSRWKQNNKNILNQIIICPRVGFDNYLTISKRFDIILDPFYFGMGNTFYHAMAFGIPVLSMPASQARGRIVYGGYKQMGIKIPPIAKSPKEYILLCKKLAFDNTYRENIRTQILSKAKDNLFNDKTIHKQFIDFFEQALEAAYKKELLPMNWEPATIN
ncbi:tetratricopeptide repeat protein [Prochlorococcus sp. MIT 0916]|uniref:tetratricopeptide repeat protein n=1 Tax=Prochlorococcus sp. MIT 0916 TaxID=3082521 RepID=UPI0039B4FA57